jgi:carboxypeptidase T
MHRLITAVFVLYASVCFAHDGGLTAPKNSNTWVVASGKITDEELIVNLNERYDLWAHELKDGKTTVALPRAALLALQKIGVDLEIDEIRTAQMNAPAQVLAPGQKTIPNFPCYRTVEETYDRLQSLVATYPNLAQVVDIGDSWDKLTAGGSAGYDLLDLVIKNNAVSGPKAPFILAAAMHARELTTAETALRFAEQILTNYATDGDFKYLVDHSEIHIISQFNPDGRKFAEQSQFWRKNVNNNQCPNSSTRGVDLNRNHSFRWGVGASTAACADNFRGPSAASETETTAIENLMATVFTDQRGPSAIDAAPPTTTGVLVSLHSFSEYILYPWEGDYNVPAPNREGLAALARKLGHFLPNYIVCQTCFPPQTGGTTPEKAYGEYGVAAFTYEIGDNFFETCAAYEANMATQNLASLKFALKSARRPYLEPTGPEIINASASISGANLVLSARADDTRRTFSQDSYPIGAPIVINSPLNTEATQNISAVRYSIDSPPWISAPVDMTAADGNFNSNIETANLTIPIGALSPGQHIVYFTGSDAGGATGVPTAVLFNVINNDVLLQSGFEGP